MNTKDTIYALSTPPGVSATSTVRISGPIALRAVSSLSKKPIGFFKHKTANVLNIFNKDNNLIDKCVIIFYRAPHSYTGENLVEVHTHGNQTIIKNLFNCLAELGLRVANPGEFTRKAYLNNKIDLVQVEATLNLINSQSKMGIDLSLNNLGGALSNKFASIKKNLIHTLSLVEHELDISETENLNQTKKLVSSNISISIKEVKALINSHKTARIFSDGARIVLLGKPNVGKSTLFNALLGHNRSIVTRVPGTTRDTIEAPKNISGFSVTLVDTAGLRTTEDPVESAGVNKTLSEIKSADLIISLVDSPPTNTKTKTPKNAPLIMVYNKIDLLSKKELNKLTRYKNIDAFISAKTKRGLDVLFDLIEKNIENNLPTSDGFFITSNRQKEVLVSIKKTLSTLPNSKPLDLEIVALEIKSALNQFNWLLGKTTPNDVLDEVFSMFCVGK